MSWCIECHSALGKKENENKKHKHLHKNFILFWKLETKEKWMENVMLNFSPVAIKSWETSESKKANSQKLFLDLEWE